MTEARCACGAVALSLAAPSALVVACHCRDCQRRSGAPFGVGAFYPADAVTISGTAKEFARIADSGRRVRMYFCPDCGTTVYWEPARFPDTIAVAVGAFADPGFPAPRHSVYERHRHPWVDTSIAPEHLD